MTHEVELWNKYMEAKEAARGKNSDDVEGQSAKAAWVDWLDWLETGERAQDD